MAEARLIMQKLTRVSTLMAQLQLSKEDSIPDLLNYWSTGLQLRRKEMEPLMCAVVLTKGLSRLHLLPSLPRKLLYTYPDMSCARKAVHSATYLADDIMFTKMAPTFSRPGC